MVCALDNETEGTMSALASRDVAAAAVAESARKGYLDGQALAGVFTWLRPNDLVWNYVVNNYLLGKDPPAFDILYWNQDTVRLAAGLHRDFIQIGLDNAFVHPDALTVLGDPVDLGQVDIDTYFVAGLTDHIVPWESAYNGALLFGGRRRFVLSKSGHIQSLVNPPTSGQPLLLPGGRRSPGGAREVLRADADAPGQLVVGLGRMACRARRANSRTHPRRSAILPTSPGRRRPGRMSSPTEGTLTVLPHPDRRPGPRARAAAAA